VIRVQDQDQKKLARLEAILFLAREPITYRKLATLANLADGTAARTLVERLRTRYDTRGCSFQIESIAGGVQLFTRAHVAPWLRKTTAIHPLPPLSGPALCDS
jgi:segregation and condensation protein B